MSLALWAAGWGTSLVLALAVLRLRRRLELVARATHELRGPATAIGLAAERLRREPGGARRVFMLETQLERMRAGLADLELARSGRRAEQTPVMIPLERLLRGTAAGWRPVVHAGGRALRVRSEVGRAAVRADRGRLAQVLGNLLANAVEHGSGTVELRGRRSDGRVVLEVRDEGARGQRRAGDGTSGNRGRGLGIAAAAVEDAGGSLSVRHNGRATVAAVELPAAAVEPAAAPLAAPAAELAPPATAIEPPAAAIDPPAAER